MAISLTTLNGTDSISSSRITINDNFNTILDAMNDLLSIIDVATGKINNFGYGSNNDIETEDLVVRGSAGGGISVISGNITLSNGNYVTNAGGYLEFGLGSGVRLQRVNKSLFSSPLSSFPTWNLSGVGATGGTGITAYVTLPRKTTADINEIVNPQLGALVYDVTTNTVKVCTVSGATGTWTAL
jgi:hypothetical protein